MKFVASLLVFAYSDRIYLSVAWLVSWPWVVHHSWHVLHAPRPQTKIITDGRTNNRTASFRKRDDADNVRICSGEAVGKISFARHGVGQESDSRENRIEFRARRPGRNENSNVWPPRLGWKVIEKVSNADRDYALFREILLRSRGHWCVRLFANYRRNAVVRTNVLLTT